MRPGHVLRVFTRGDEGGNHLGVVTDIMGIDDEGMQAIATELGFSETIYIDWREEGTPMARIFTPAVELPFAGHPLVGAAWVLSAIGPGTVDSIECGVGVIPFRSAGTTTWIDTPMSHAVEDAPDAAEIAAAALLPEPERAWRAMMPVPYLVLEVDSAETVAGAQPDIDRLDEAGGGMTYLMAREGDTVRARFFAPGAGVPEDPATGSAAAALAAVRFHEGETEGSVRIDQGAEIGHPSTIMLRWTGEHASLGGEVRRDEVRILDR